LRSTRQENCRRVCLSLAPTLALVVHETDTTCSHSQYAMLLSERVVLLQRKCDECWLMGYLVRYPTHPLNPHIASSASSKYLRHEGDCFSQITKHAFKYTSVRSPVRISILILPECSERISIAKTTHEIHIRILHISKSRHSCRCHCSCYRDYCPSLITALQLFVLLRTRRGFSLKQPQ